jgi:hypothetical protein
MNLTCEENEYIMKHRQIHSHKERKLIWVGFAQRTVSAKQFLFPLDHLAQFSEFSCEQVQWWRSRFSKQNLILAVSVDFLDEKGK